MHSLIPIFAAASVLTLGVASSLAQPVPASSADVVSVQLSPFEVSTDRDTGYQAVDTMSGGRMAINLLANPSDVSVLTRDFLNDIGALDMTEMTNWLTSTVQTDNSEDRDFGNSLSIRGLSAGVNLRNYFRYDTSIEGYIIERVEGSRGPNALMYGESNAGGSVGIATKQAKFRNFNSADLRTDSNGSIYSAIDLNRKVSDKLALRAAAFYSERNSWYDRSFNDRRGAFLTGTFRPWKDSSIRVDLEQTRAAVSGYRLYTDQTSNWDGVTTVAGPLAANPVTTTGLAARNNNTFGVVIFPGSTGKAYNFQNYTQTTGSGLTLNSNDPRPDNRTPFPTLPSRKYQLSPADETSDQETYYYSLVFEQKLTEGLNLQLATDSSFVGRDTNLWTVGGNAVRTDVATNLPDGSTNPNLGKLYVDSRWGRTITNQWTQNYRATASYDLKFGGNTQIFSANWLRRDGNFDVVVEREGRANGTDTRRQLAVNNVTYRLYLDQPGLGITRPQSVDGVEIRNFLTRDSLNLSTLESVVLATIGTYFDDKLTVFAGWRSDDVSTDQRAHTTYDINGDIDGFRYFERENTDQSKSAGFTYFPVNSVGIYANYAEGFLPIQNENDWVGSRGVVEFTNSESISAGFRFKLRENFLVGSVGYYDIKEPGRVVTVSKTQINSIWTTMAATNPGLADREIGGPFGVFNDTLDYSASGFEADILMNVSKQLRLTANFALPETEQDNANPDLIEYYNTNVATWQAGAADPGLTAAQRTSIQNNINTILGLVNGAVNGRTINGTSKYRANIFANYTFSTDRLKGFSIGAGANFFGKQLIGNTTLNGFDYVYADAYSLVLARAGYNFKYRNLPVSLQLTVNNLLDYKDPIYRNLANVGGVTYRNTFIFVEPRTVSLNLNVKF